jgi:hypothetical protein
MFTEQFVSQNLTRFTAPRHRINVEICKTLLVHIWLIAIREALRIVFEDIP